MIIPSATLAKDYWTVYSMDDALDRGFPKEPPKDPAELSEWETKKEAWLELWRKALEENTLDQLPCVVGQKPVRWRLRHLRGTADKYLRDHVHEHKHPDAFGVQTIYRAAQLSLVEVKDAFLADGREYKLKHTVSAAGFPEVTEETMSQLEQIDDNALVYELGLRVLTQMYLPKNS